MPGIIDLQTNLRDLSYGSGKQPYIQTPIPAYDDPNPTNHIGRDALGRTGLVNDLLTDVERIGKWALDGTGGLIFVTKQNALSLTGVKTVANAPKRAYLPTNTAAQIAVGANQGIHFIQPGLVPDIDDTNKYEYVQRNEFSGNSGGLNRLTALKKAKLNGETNPLFTEIQINNTNEGVLLQYLGGPGSALGIGNTKIRRTSYTEEWVNNLAQKELKKQIVALTYNQLDNQVSLTNLTGTGLASIGNFLVTLNDESTASPAVKQRILGRLTDYSQFNRDKTFGTGQPGNGGVNFNRQTYDDTPTHGTDLVNFFSIYKSTEAKTGQGYDDIIKFHFAVMDNDNPEEKTYVHFRAYLTQFNDSHQSQWNSFKYMGRGENFYRYEGYDRSISIGFKVYIHSKAELFPAYKKLNYLASVMAPDYSPGGFMRGNIVEVTIGDYLNNVPGILESMEFQFPEDSTWEIARKDDGNIDNTAAELPRLIEVSCNFKPIHNFLPSTATNPDNPYPKFISLGADAKGYAPAPAPEPLTPVPPAPIPNNTPPPGLITP